MIVTGDFNAKAGANKAYDLLLADGWLSDSWHGAKERRGEVVATVNNFQKITPGDHRIDWILGRGIETEWIQIITCQKDGQFPSDHFPVMGEIRLK
jgi:endonuclease/exonuclease/phosphatase family metal-dependent hydrolase